MKCPKCGFNSFEYLDSCKKCNNDLAAHKQSLGIKAIVLPATQFVSREEVAADEAYVAEAGGADTFSWESGPADGFDMAAPATAAAPAATDTFGEFSFEETAEPAGGSVPATPQGAQEDGFADFLEHGSSSVGEFGSDVETASEKASAAAARQITPPGGDFELDDIFKGGETAPAAPVKPPAPKPKTAAGDIFSTDEFAALFQEPEEKK